MGGEKETHVTIASTKKLLASGKDGCSRVIRRSWATLSWLHPSIQVGKNWSVEHRMS